MSRHVYLVLTNPITADREEEFNDWYTNTHIPEVLTVPGFVAARRFKLSDESDIEKPYGYMALYEIEMDDPNKAFEALGAALPNLAMSDALDMQNIATWVFSPITDRKERQLSKHVFLVLVNPTTLDRDEEFNKWYTYTHIPDVLKTPGFVSAQRFKISDTRDIKKPYRYMTLYGVEADDPNKARKALTQAGEEMVMSDSLDRMNIGMWMFTAITDRVVSA